MEELIFTVEQNNIVFELNDVSEELDFLVDKGNVIEFTIEKGTSENTVDTSNLANKNASNILGNDVISWRTALDIYYKTRIFKILWQTFNLLEII